MTEAINYGLPLRDQQSSRCRFAVSIERFHHQHAAAARTKPFFRTRQCAFGREIFPKFSEGMDLHLIPPIEHAGGIQAELNGDVPAYFVDPLAPECTGVRT